MSWSHPTMPLLSTFSSAHVIAVQLHFDRRVLPDGNICVSNRDGVFFDAVTDEALHWRDRKEEGIVVQVLLDDELEYEEASDELLIRTVRRDLAAFIPQARGATPPKYHILRPNAIYTEIRPGYWAGVLRPGMTFAL